MDGLHILRVQKIEHATVADILPSDVNADMKWFVHCFVLMSSDL